MLLKLVNGGGNGFPRRLAVRSRGFGPFPENRDSLLVLGRIRQIEEKAEPTDDRAYFF